MKFIDALTNGLLFYDGGMGTMLQAAGLQPGECPDAWAITHPEAVRDIHLAYYDAGANIVLTDTFGNTANKVAASGYSAAEIARAAVTRVREAAALVQRRPAKVRGAGRRAHG